MGKSIVFSLVLVLLVMFLAFVTEPKAEIKINENITITQN